MKTDRRKADQDKSFVDLFPACFLGVNLCFLPGKSDFLLPSKSKDGEDIV